MVTQQQVADRAGVSRRTVDRVLNHVGGVKPETEKRVREVLEELDYYPDEAGQILASKKRSIRIGFCSLAGRTSVLHEQIRNGAQQEAKKLKKKGVDVIFFTINRDHLPDKKTMQSMLEELGQCDGLVVLNEGGECVQKFISLANEKKLPVVFYNVDGNADNKIAYVGCDYYRSGRMAAGVLGINKGFRWRIGIFTIGETPQAFESPNYKNRVDGFKAEIEQYYPEMEIIGEYMFPWDVYDCYEKIKRTMDDCKDMNAIYLVNPGDYSVCKAIKKVAGERNLEIITNDLTSEAVDILRNGTLTATISQGPEKQGMIPLNILFEYLVFGREPDQELFYTDLNIFIPQSII